VAWHYDEVVFANHLDISVVFLALGSLSGKIRRHPIRPEQIGTFPKGNQEDHREVHVYPRQRDQTADLFILPAYMSEAEWLWHTFARRTVGKMVRER
jgi:hypothetical protein